MLTFRNRLATKTLMLALLAGLFVLVACTADAERIREANAAAGSSNAIDQLAGQISVFDLRDGDCFDAPEIAGSGLFNLEDVKLVGCSGEWSFLALNSFVVARDGDYPGEDYFMEEGYRRCDRLADTYLFPLPESWEFGDRTVMCIGEA